MKGILKWPLIVAAIVVVLRVIAERLGAPHMISASLSIAALTTVLGPLYFALQTALAEKPRPYATLFKLIFIYAVCARAMVLPTYWAARIFGWRESRFAGVDTDNPFIGFIVLPVVTAGFWIAVSMVSGGVIGVIVLKIMKSRETR